MPDRKRRQASPFRAEHWYPTVLRQLVVKSVEAFVPGFVRLILTGEQLGEFTDGDGIHPPMCSIGFDDVVVLCFPDPLTGLSHPPTVDAAGAIETTTARHDLAREYTVRRLDHTSNELVIDIALHPAGLATDWARRACPGMSLDVIGTRRSRDLPTPRHLMAVADASAVPAAARLIDELPDDAIGEVILDVPSAEYEIPMAPPPGIAITWLHSPAGSGAAVLDELRTRTTAPEDVFFWLAGESSVVTSLRRFLVDDRNVPRPRIQFTGYWRK